MTYKSSGLCDGGFGVGYWLKIMIRLILVVVVNPGKVWDV